jgi:hypothetical protein
MEETGRKILDFALETALSISFLAVLGALGVLAVKKFF